MRVPAKTCRATVTGEEVEVGGGHGHYLAKGGCVCDGHGGSRDRRAQSGEEREGGVQNRKYRRGRGWAPATATTWQKGKRRWVSMAEKEVNSVGKRNRRRGRQMSAWMDKERGKGGAVRGSHRTCLVRRGRSRGTFDLPRILRVACDRLKFQPARRTQAFT